MAIENIYTNSGFDQNMDVSATTRKFQTSVVITQDVGKSGILTFLENVPIVTTPQSIETLSQTPKRSESDY